MTFSRKLGEFNAGKLKNLEEKRIRDRKFERIEKIVVEYIELREKLYQKDKCGLSWQFLATKAFKAAELFGITHFSASAGWMQGVRLRRNNKMSVVLHGEANQLTDEQAG
jgi:hypothetical protein